MSARLKEAAEMRERGVARVARISLSICAVSEARECATENAKNMKEIKKRTELQLLQVTLAAYKSASVYVYVRAQVC